MFGTQKKEEIDSLAHTRWNCKYHIVFAMVFSITHRCVNFIVASYCTGAWAILLNDKLLCYQGDPLKWSI